jgi:uncharacterized protein (DUF1800 family)
LIQRAGFGIPRHRVEDLAAMSPEEAVASFVSPPDSGALPPPPVLPPISYAERRRLLRDLNEQERRKARQERQREEREAHQRLQAWWIERLATTEHPLQEKMALFWHGHFATSAQKVKASYQTGQLNDIFRSHGLGNTKALTIAVGQSPAMLSYLDNRRSTRLKPNENWARELMELFTMGQGQYTEEDIKASARAFTGWTCDQEKFQYNMDAHDPGPKTFLGRTGTFDGWNIIDIIFEQEATARFLAAKLWSFFAYENPSDELVTALADALRSHNYELKPFLMTLFHSEEFYSASAVGSQVKSPAQYVVQLAEDLGIEDPPYAAMAKATATLGQNLFYPPNVKGWEGNRAWINANSLLLRYNLPPKLTSAAAQTYREHEMTMSGDAMMAGEPSMTMAPKPGAADREAARQALKAKLAQLPRDERRSILKSLRTAKGPQRKMILEELGLRPQLPPAVDPANLFDELEYGTASECLAALEKHFLSVPLGSEQRIAFLKAVGVSDPEQALSPDQIPTEKRHAVLHLLLSTAEYQLC